MTALIVSFLVALLRQLLEDTRCDHACRVVRHLQATLTGIQFRRIFSLLLRPRRGPVGHRGRQPPMARRGWRFRNRRRRRHGGRRQRGHCRRMDVGSFRGPHGDPGAGPSTTVPRTTTEAPSSPSAHLPTPKPLTEPVPCLGQSAVDVGTPAAAASTSLAAATATVDAAGPSSLPRPQPLRRTARIRTGGRGGEPWRRFAVRTAPPQPPMSSSSSGSRARLHFYDIEIPGSEEETPSPPSSPSFEVITAGELAGSAAGALRLATGLAPPTPAPSPHTDVMPTLPAQLLGDRAASPARGHQRREGLSTPADLSPATTSAPPLRRSGADTDRITTKGGRAGRGRRDGAARHHGDTDGRRCSSTQRRSPTSTRWPGAAVRRGTADLTRHGGASRRIGAARHGRPGAARRDAGDLAARRR
ncbi:hypothetical protein PR202_gb08384 [Eleusine coracana subsp. coracana]|uniref:Uncharacterized protein n=1 Tax=Eleusine coracana subsp. coracana TaxID=191504 RepID=A0AAV5EEI1_ELECO|nr:hypothetical protein PR202_gb08384 [Eleusine coracana subsp. coracana]